MKKKKIQTVILKTFDGRTARYSGPVQLKEGDLISKIEFSEMDLLEGYKFEELKDESKN